MATRALIPVEVYLTSVYRPDCDYVDGEVLERLLVRTAQRAGDLTGIGFQTFA